MIVYMSLISYLSKQPSNYSDSSSNFALTSISSTKFVKQQLTRSQLLERLKCESKLKTMEK
jgi:hypothetical protein